MKRSAYAGVSAAKVIALLAIALGAALSFAGAKVEGGALAVLGAVALVTMIDFGLMPGWLIGAGTFFCLHHIGAYTVSPLGQIWAQGYVNRRYLEGFVMAQWGAALGLVTWSLVYPWVFRATAKAIARNRNPKSTADHSTRSAQIYTVLLTIISSTIFVLLYQVGLSRIEARASEVSPMTASLVLGFQFAAYVVCLFLAYFAFRNQGWWLILWSIGVGAFSVWQVLDGSRSTIVLAGCFSACGFYYGGMRLRTVVMGSSAAVILIVPLFAVIQSYRDAYSGIAQSFYDRVHGFQETLTDYTATSIGTVDGATSVFFDRLSPDPVDYIFFKTPDEIPFAGFSGISRIPYMFLPQVILPDRPDLIDGNEVAIEYGAGGYGTHGNSLSVVGDGYRRFGWLGIVMLYAFIATCVALVSATAWVFRDRPEWLSSLIVLLLCLNGENTMSTLVSTFYYMIWIFPKYLLFFLALRMFSDFLARTNQSWVRPRASRVQYV